METDAPGPGAYDPKVGNTKFHDGVAVFGDDDECPGGIRDEFRKLTHPIVPGTSNRFSSAEDRRMSLDKENNGASPTISTPVNRRQTLCGSSAAGLRAALPGSAQKKVDSVDMNKLRDDNKVLKAQVKEEGRLRCGSIPSISLRVVRLRAKKDARVSLTIVSAPTGPTRAVRLRSRARSSPK